LLRVKQSSQQVKGQMHEDGFSALSGIWRPGNTSALRQDVQAVDDFVTFLHGYIPCFAGALPG
jgi:hypothetical protein